jgi:hypothetical protein
MLGESVIALAAAVRCIADAKAQIESYVAIKCNPLDRGEFDAANASALRIRDLRRDLKYFETVLASVTAQVRESSIEMGADEVLTLQKSSEGQFATGV